MLHKLRNEIATPTLTQLAANTETEVDFSERDDKTVLIISASSETTLTVKAGNGIQGVNDKTFTVPAGISLLKLDSGRFKFVSGEHKDKILVQSPGTPKIGVVAIV